MLVFAPAPKRRAQFWPGYITRRPHPDGEDDSKVEDDPDKRWVKFFCLECRPTQVSDTIDKIKLFFLLSHPSENIVDVNTNTIQIMTQSDGQYR